MERRKKISALMVSAVMLVCLLFVNITAVYAWFNGQGYQGKTMSYSRRMYIGVVGSNLTNYFGYLDTEDEFVYTEINPLVGFVSNNLVPGSYIYLRTDIENLSNDSAMIVSLYLQDIQYEESLHSFIYLGTTDPYISREIYKNDAIYDALTETYTIESAPLITGYSVPANQTISLYWYIYIDSDAGMEVANATMNLGKVALLYN